MNDVAHDNSKWRGLAIAQIHSLKVKADPVGRKRIMFYLGSMEE
jgi:hypothetical protein